MDINDLYNSQITVNTATASQASFGTPGILATFPAGTKGFAASGPGSRVQVRTSLAALLADGWGATDSVYLAAKAVFAQPTHAKKVLIGRIDSGDASIDVSGAAIRAESDDWWAFCVVGYLSLKLTFSADLVSGNVATLTVNDLPIAPVTWATSHAATMAALLAAIQVVYPAATGTVDGDVLNVTLLGTDLYAATVAVVGGASQPTCVVSYVLDRTKMRGWMDWAATQIKTILISDSDPASYASPTGDVSTACLMEYGRLKGYRRAAVMFHFLPGEYIQMASAGLELYFAPGIRTWAFKGYTGVTADNLTPTQDQSIRAKGGNTYTQVYGAGGPTGVVMNFAGTCCAVDTYLDDVRGTDWLNSLIQTDQLNLSVANPKIPYNNAGIQLRVETLRGSLKKGQQNTVLDPETDPVIVYPDASECSAADKAARILNGVSWSGSYAGAIQTMPVTGTISFPMN